MPSVSGYKLYKPPYIFHICQNENVLIFLINTFFSKALKMVVNYMVTHVAHWLAEDVSSIKKLAFGLRK